jgi:hypothetical protein
MEARNQLIRKLFVGCHAARLGVGGSAVDGSGRKNGIAIY